ncbi:MAG TPA: acyl-CoA dehydrogenase family protein [Actinomycetota bacterium]|nr:acyl-CoA dehydrogenase family protein [Actinomycetota bacterium]
MSLELPDLLEAACELAPRVRELAPETEDGRRLPDELADAFGRIGLWRACLPTEAGGPDVPDLNLLLQTLRVLSTADGSAGWCAMIGATSGLVFAYLDQSVAKRIVTSDGRFCTGGVFAPSGKATPVDGGWRVSGRWSFASGVDHTTWLSLGVLVGDPPHARGVLVPTSEVEILDTWHVSGLRGTGSKDLVADNVFVPIERTFQLIGGTPQVEDTFHRFPLFGLLVLGVASVALGIARGAIDDLVALATDKTPSGSRRRLADRAHAQMEVAAATAELAAAEAFIIHDVGTIYWDAFDGEDPSLHDRARLRLAATHATRTAARVVDRMYELGGGSSIYSSNRLQRAFRDVHAATQHMVTAPATYELAGRILLGVETDVSQL